MRLWLPARWISAFLLLVGLLSITQFTWAAPPINTLPHGAWALLSQPKDIAINGYDPVAYLKGENPVKGKKGLTADWKGAHWLFSSRQNLDLFQSDPNKWSPQFGGYCANGVSLNQLVSVDADAFVIRDKKLYLFHSHKGKKEWLANPQAKIKQAHKNFPALLAKPLG